ncbi:hypothetical protein CEXT_269731 [Caerostris extrusa]|uniref:Uncharacterized protein n=1 Tax=Caerostris extrusa TaxID=172846 RepID=A0AAV4PG95_CAEEX|nr:hypothetical protein CEXT_269731 [Caerostris extrusa]
MCRGPTPGVRPVIDAVTATVKDLGGYATGFEAGLLEVLKTSDPKQTRNNFSAESIFFTCYGEMYHRNFNFVASDGERTPRAQRALGSGHLT